jgi:hypothetical protein
MVKKIFLIALIFLFFSCKNNTDLEDCSLQFPVSVTKSLSLPEVNSAQVPGGFAFLNNEGRKGILLLNINGNDFVAYDRLCPNDFCSTPMSFDGSFTLECSCDGSKYGIGPGIGGAPQTNGFDCPAIEYQVLRNGNTIRIINF